MAGDHLSGRGRTQERFNRSQRLRIDSAQDFVITGEAESIRISERSGR
jgi:hypothetical protein